MVGVFFVYLFGGLKFSGQSFAYVAHLVFFLEISGFEHSKVVLNCWKILAHSPCTLNAAKVRLKSEKFEILIL
jgi:hypothetical protein